MAGEGWIVMCRWDEFQHRDMARSSVPPWIKNYTKLLHDDAYLGLTAAERGVLHGLWMEYANSRRELRLDTGYTPAGYRLDTSKLSRRLNVRVTQKTIKRLSDAGFIEVSASKPASEPASNLASLEVEVEKKEELRSSTNTAIARQARQAKRRLNDELLTAGRRFAADWKGGTSLAFDAGLDELERLAGAKLQAGDRSRLWDQALVVNGG